MSETFIYFIWQFQYFTKLNLTTTDGEPVQVLHPGFRNYNAGPDFFNARLLINSVEWGGTVEMHTKTSDWLAHRHQDDRAYDNVILHVVWEDDRIATGRQVDRANGTPLPTLELRPLTDNTLIDRYALLMNSRDSIPCAGQFRSVQPLRLTSMLDKALLQRLERKAAHVQALFDATGGDWEETAYRLLALNMGFKTNADPMAQLSRAVPLKAILKHRDVLLQVEAMLFGTAGLLDAIDAPDDYTIALQREYRFLSVKYQLANRQVTAHAWKWGRLRPANFPTLRLAQFARLVTKQASLFSLFIGNDNADRLLKSLQELPSSYWQSHYRFGKAADKVVPALGQTSAENILINTVVPLLAAYAHHRGQPAYIDRAVSLLEQLPAEKNRLTDAWDELGLGIRTAFDSQAAIELYNEFCTPKKCLNCQIGAGLIK
ncbi:DUF2851 family protein [Spirosoma utsteinense]|uniref:DUF2851 domain-containing protein n=1 Tax=Spirosoma utsteinense TaxID=2585773 RepID=A0ABR6WBE8_9BACT|nr:DUF2851 family protein [Spirosoma utsteinense]MBC3784043.1 hypothetical protein [Spirosoma utsteinense]MBC3793468.1 hypothetical protein [Spirosoma utsteinense]